ncbi:MAG: hypothetical protein N4A76_04450 [Firmicutes bacterium]|jgi:hypothetical protein|nr:hypothetical protein [Bacillota bacterium]
MTKYDFINQFYKWDLYDDNKILEFYDAKLLSGTQVRKLTKKTITELRKK